MADSASILNPVRSLESLGVSGLLGEDCKVFYETMFTTESIGRISDLLIAKMKGAKPDELRVRMVLLRACFEAYRSLAPNQPLTLECGIDSTRIAIGMQYKIAKTEAIKLKGLQDRINTGKPESTLEVALFNLGQLSNALVARYQRTTETFELVSVIGLKSNRDPKAAHRVEFLYIDLSEEIKETPKPASYVELGDVDYSILEKTQKPASIQEEEFKQTIAGMQESTDETRVGGTEKEEEDLVRIKGSSIEKEEEDLRKISGGEEEKPKSRFKSLFKGLLGKKEKDKPDAITIKGGANSQGEDPATTIKSSASDVFDSLFKTEDPTPVRKEIPESPYQLLTDEKFPDDEKSQAKTIAGNAAQNKEGATVVSHEESGGAEESSKVSEMLKELETLTDDASDAKLEEMSSEIRKELKSETAQRLFDQTVTAMIAERSKIKDTTRRMNAAMRQKEIEIQSKENAFKEGIRERDEQIRQKTMLLEKTREQIQNAAAEIERLKANSVRRTDANPMLKQKLAQMQNELNSNQEVNTKLMANVDELKKRLAQEKNARMAANKSTGPSQQEMLALQQRAERATKQAEEYRKNNQRLLERLEQASKRQSGSSVDTEESKRKLATATKMLAASKKDSENLNGIIHRMKADELKLKGELNRATLEVSRLKSQAALAAQNQATPVQTSQPAKAAPPAADATTTAPAASDKKDPKAA